MMTKWYSPWWRSAAIVMCALSTSGCKLSDPGLSAYLPSDQFFAVLALEHHAINLSMVPPYDTVTLHTTQAMGNGNVVPGKVVYSVSNPSISITDGVLKAESPVSRAVVRVTLTYGTITRTDSAIVSVTAAAPNLLRDFGFQVPANDSAKTSGGLIKLIPLARESESGANLSTLLVHLVSSDSTVAKVTQSSNNVSVRPRRPGRVVLHTSTYAFGAAWRDSLVFTVGWPIQFALPILERYAAGSSTPILDFAFRDITIGVGGCVVWENTSETVDLDIQFDDSSHVLAPVGHNCAQQVLVPEVGGNIAPFHRIPYDGNPENALKAYLSPFAARVFPTPGVFPYRSMLHNTGGRVRVCDEQSDTTCAPLRMGGWY